MAKQTRIEFTISEAILDAWIAAAEADALWWNAGAYDVASNPYTTRRAATAAALDVALGLRPWQQSPLDTYEEDAPPHLTKQTRAHWRAAWLLRQQLEAAASGPNLKARA